MVLSSFSEIQFHSMLLLSGVDLKELMTPQMVTNPCCLLPRTKMTISILTFVENIDIHNITNHLDRFSSLRMVVLCFSTLE